MKKRANKHKSGDNNTDSFDPAKFKEETELTSKSIQKFLANTLHDRNSKKKDIDALVHTVQEFLNSFIVLGYTVDGDPVHIISAHNQQEADSLATLVNKTFIQSHNQDNS